MARKKTKRQVAATRQAGSASAPRPAAPAAGSEALAAAPPVGRPARPVPQATGGNDAVLRAVERSITTQNTRARVPDIYLDASIPLERVPYFKQDLRMIAIVMGSLVLLLLLTGTLLLDRIVRLF